MDISSCMVHVADDSSYSNKTEDDGGRKANASRDEEKRSASVYMKSSYTDTFTEKHTGIPIHSKAITDPVTSGTDRCSQAPAKKLIGNTYY